MIPKIIHYCWLSGDAYPKLVQQCIASWQRLLPDFAFRLWDKSCLPRIDSAYANEAFEQKVYAAAADIIRLWAVYHYGGFYLDMDVEVLRDLSSLTRFPYVFGVENGTGGIEAAVFGAEPGMAYLKDCLNFYEGKHYTREDLYPLPGVMKEVVGEMRIINFENEFVVDSPSILVFNYDFLLKVLWIAKSGARRRSQAIPILFIIFKSLGFHSIRSYLFGFDAFLGKHLRSRFFCFGRLFGINENCLLSR